MTYHLWCRRCGLDIVDVAAPQTWHSLTADQRVLFERVHHPDCR